MLHNLTIAINFTALMAALWLGLYLVTRSSQHPVAWLSALALWSVGGYFLNQLLALYPPPAPQQEIRVWLYHLMLFWPRDVFEMGWKGWLQGWLPSYSIIFWYHATLYTLPGKFTRKRLLGALFGYMAALAGILIKVHYSDAWTNLYRDPLYNTSSAYPFFPLFAFGFVTFAGLSLLNLARAARSSPASMPRAQFWLFVYAVLLSGASGLLGIISTILNIPIPQVLSALFLLVALLLAGVGVAHCTASLDMRPLPRGLLYSAARVTAFLAIFLLLLMIYSGLHPLPAISYVFVGCLAVISHSLIHIAHPQLDRLHFNNENRKLHLRLNQLSSLAGSKENSEVLGMALETLAGVVKAAWAIVLCESKQGVRLLASWNWKDFPLKGIALSLEIGNLPANDLIVLKPQQLSPPLDQTAVVVPLYNQDPHSLLLVGPRRDRSDYSKPELEMLQDAGVFIAGMIQGRISETGLSAQGKDNSFSDVLEQPARTAYISLRTVELALRNLHNYAYLADSPLAKLRIVLQCMESLEMGTDTLMDRGKAVSDILSEAVLKLRPSQEEMPNPPPREWYPYIILWQAYVEDRPNLEIISRLYISEGTFNRTRKAAIYSVARLLMEMEAR